MDDSVDGRLNYWLARSNKVLLPPHKHRGVSARHRPDGFLCRGGERIQLDRNSHPSLIVAGREGVR